MEKKILFLDLDGTLLNDHKEITPGNRQAINAALEQGHQIVIASGNYPLNKEKIHYDVSDSNSQSRICRRGHCTR